MGAGVHCGCAGPRAQEPEPGRAHLARARRGPTPVTHMRKTERNRSQHGAMGGRRTYAHPNPGKQKSARVSGARAEGARTGASGATGGRVRWPERPYVACVRSRWPRARGCADLLRIGRRASGRKRDPGGAPAKATGGRTRAGAARRACTWPVLGTRAEAQARRVMAVLTREGPKAKRIAINPRVTPVSGSPTYRTRQDSGEARGRARTVGPGAARAKDMEAPGNPNAGTGVKEPSAGEVAGGAAATPTAAAGDP